MLYLLGGENLYESLAKLKNVRQDYEKKEGYSLKIVNADEIDNYEEIIKDTESLSLFSTKQVLLIKRLFSAKTHIQNEVTNYIKSKQSNNLHIILWEDKAFDKRKALYKYIKKKGIAEEFSLPRYVSLKSWISSYIKRHIEFEDSVIDLLILKIGYDQMQISLTLDNLITLIKSRRKKKLTEEDVHMFVVKSAEESIWDFIDAIGAYDKACALSIVESLLREKKDFVLIIGMIARQFRILALVKYLLERGKNYNDILSILKLHPFVLRKAISHSENFSMGRLRKLFEKLVKTDLAVKEGRFDEKLALDLLIAAL